MTDDGREAQSKSDRRAPSAGNSFDRAAPPAAKPVGAAPWPGPAPVGPAAPPPAPAAPVATPPGAPQPRAAAQPAFSPMRSAYSPPVAARVEQDEDEPDDADLLEEPLTLSGRMRALQPAPVILSIGSIGAIAFLARAMTSHTTPVPVLMSAGVVSCLVFGIDAGVASIGTWRASRDGETRRALLLSVIGGIAALISAGAFAGVLVLVLVLNS